MARRSDKKRRRHGTGSIREHGNGYEVSVSIGGKRRYFSASTKMQAEAIIRQVVRDSSVTILGQGRLTRQGETVGEFTEGWLGTLEDLSDNTRYGYERIVHNYILPAFGERLVSSVTTMDVQTYVEELKREKKSPKTIKNIITVLSSIMRIAVCNNILLVNPVRGVKLPAVHNVGLTSQVMDVDYHYFLNLVKNEERSLFNNLFYIALLTGMRRGELFGLTWDKVDFTNRTIHINVQLQKEKLNKGGYVYTSVKLKHAGRSVVFSRHVFDCLKEIKAEQERKIKAGEYENVTGFVFVMKDGSHLKNQTVHQAFRAFVSSHPDLPQDMRFHDLRGSFATHALDVGMDPKALSYILGHTSVEFTLRRYARASNRKQIVSAELLDKDLALFEGLKSRTEISEKLKRFCAGLGEDDEENTL